MPLLIVVLLIGCESKPSPSKYTGVLDMGGLSEGWGVTATPVGHPRIMLHGDYYWIDTKNWSGQKRYSCNECHKGGSFISIGGQKNNRQSIEWKDENDLR